MTVLALARLGRGDTAKLIAGVAGDVSLPAQIVHEIVQRTDGVPLFIEELTKATVEAGEAGEALSSGPRPTLSVPPTLQSSLVARFDRLGPAAKSIAQKAASIGREFDYGLIAAIAASPMWDLQQALAMLAGAGLLIARGIPPHSSYVFKHALVTGCHL